MSGPSFRGTGLLVLILAAVVTAPVVSAVRSQEQALPTAVSVGSTVGTQRIPIEPDKPVRGEVKQGESHTYLLDLVEGQFTRLSLEKNSADVVFNVSRPDGETITEAKSSAPGEPLGVVLIARVSGNHVIEVRSLGSGDARTPYTLKVVELRAATEADHNRVAAAKSYTEGMRLLEKGDEASLTESVRKFEQAAGLFKALGESSDQAALLSYLGYAQSRLNRHNESIDAYRRALSVYREIGDRSGEAGALAGIAAAYERLGQREKAIEYHEQTVSVASASGDGTREAAALTNIGRLYYLKGEGRKGLEFYNRAIPVYRNIGDRRGEAEALRVAAVIHGSLTEFEEALTFLAEALRINRSIEHREGEAGVLINIGGVYTSLSEYQKAIDHYNQALPLLRDHSRGEGAVRNNLGRVYLLLGDYEQAAEQFSQSLARYREAADPPNEATVLYHLGVCRFRTGDNRGALEFYRQALSLFRKVGHRAREASTLNAIGSVHVSMKEYETALDYYNQSLPVNRSTGNLRGEAATLNNMGRVYLSIGETDKALDFHKEALGLIRRARDRRGEAQMLYNIARAHSKRGDLAEARSHGEAAITLAEELRQSVSGDQLRSSLVASVRNFFELHIDVLMRMHGEDPARGHDRVALEMSERARARSLVDLLAEARIDIREGVDAGLLERERRLERLLDTKTERQAQLISGRHTPEQAAAAEREIETVLAEHRQARTQIRAASPRYASLTQPEPIAFSDVRKLLDEDTLLLEYALGENRSYLWAVSASSVTSHVLPKREEVEDVARRFYELLKSREAKAEASVEMERLAGELSRMLLSPVADQLGSRRLAIVADGVLHYIPFAALALPNSASKDSLAQGAEYVPLVSRHEIVNIPSASVLAEIRRDTQSRKAASRAVFILADPVFSRDDPRLRPGDTAEGAEAEIVSPDLLRAMADVGKTGGETLFSRLPFSRREANAIAASVPSGQSTTALDFSASRDVATRTDLSEYRIIHFATHGVLNSKHPELSGIVLSLLDSQGRPRNGFLRLHEIYDLKVPAELVVLSACQTGLGKEIRGEGLVGLTRGFMYAGAPRVMASLWMVDDAATAELMKRFYSGMFTRNLAPARALKEAQVDMWKQRRWRSPFYWAAFVLQGEWK